MSLKTLFVEKENKKELKRIEKTVRQAEEYAEKFADLPEEKWKEKTGELKERLEEGETMDDILPEAFGLVMMADSRILHMKPFHCQIQGGIILHQGKIAEMKTGEGKTLVETMPAFLHALEGRGVHIVTVNNYLAKRDGEKMGQVFRALGLSVGIIQHNSTQDERKAAYACDITYITNDELGFDYLRDNTASFKSQVVQRGLNYAIIDEVDSVLIDEARTPLILSGKSDVATALYKKCDAFAKSLTEGGKIRKMAARDRIFGDLHTTVGDFETDEKEANIVLTADGVAKAEKFFDIENLASPANLEICHGIQNALRAVYLLKSDRDYVVNNGEVLLVDNFTGRILSGRRYSDGLHQAVEAKEGVKIYGENITLASITFQSLFNLYKKKGGMTGTAMAEQQEFLDVYNLPIVPIPTNKPVIRKDLPDVVYRTKQEKLDRVLYEAQKAHELGRPVLIGTSSVESSEEISKLLYEQGVDHNLLNAKNNEKEAVIIAEAGKAGAVTVATNMAGRGTDIMLDAAARNVGGLLVIGTERHESSRIDDQLRGRSGRQGDPGTSIFLISLEDELLKHYAVNKMDRLYEHVGLSEHGPLKGKAISRIVEYAQKNVENYNFTERSDTYRYDRIINAQRQGIYQERRDILDGKDIHNSIVSMVPGVVSEITASYPVFGDEEIKKELSKELETELGIKMAEKEIPGQLEKLPEMAKKLYKDAFGKTEIGENGMKELERLCLLKAIDIHWIQGAEEEEFLRTCAWQDSMAQKDPEIEFQMKSADVFRDIANAVKKDTVRMLFGVLNDEGGTITIGF